MTSDRPARRLAAPLAMVVGDDAAVCADGACAVPTTDAVATGVPTDRD